MGTGTPWFSTDRYSEQKREALQRFGRMLRTWRIRNGWTQHTASQWGKQAGFQAIAAGNFSHIEHGKTNYVRPGTIFQLADLNQRIAGREWGPVRNRELRERLESSKPITDDHGVPWGPTEFWACSVGLIPVPAELDEPEGDPVPELTDEAAKLMSQQWRMELQEVLLERDLDPIDAFGELSKLLPQQHRRRFRQVMSVSGADYKASELLELWDNGWLPERALSTWIMQMTHN